jgi:hypothetical protein
MKKVEDFYIVKSPAAITFRLVSVILVAEITFALLVFLLLKLRDVAVFDSLTYVIFWSAFTVKALLVAVTVYIDMNNWSGTLNYTSGNLLITSNSSNMKGSKTNVHKLSNLSKVEIKQSALQKRANYGTLYLKISKTSFKEEVVLKDVLNPTLIAKKLEQISNQ